MTPAIEVANLSLNLGKQTILREIDLNIPQGSFLTLIGPNGAGKTSFLKCLLRLYDHWTGKIKVAGQNTLNYSRRELARLIGYVPQVFKPDIQFTCLEFLLMARYPYLSPFTTLTRQDYSLAEKWLDQIGAQAWRNRPLADLSGGERQLVLIAGALAQGASVILLDEPTASLDYSHHARVFRLLRELNQKEGITVVATMHDINAACQWSSRIAALRDGSLLCHLLPAEMLQVSRLKEVYQADFDLIKLPDDRKLAVLTDRFKNNQL